MRNHLLAIFILTSLSFAGCQSSDRAAESKQPEANPQPAVQAQGSPAPVVPAAAPAQVKASPTPIVAAATPAQVKATPTPAPAAAAKQSKAPVEPIMLAGAALGPVRFEHSKHAVACESCHHAPQEPKPGTAAQAACTSCHTKPPQAGMKTGKQAAFHNPTATAGTCIDCHKKTGGKAPTKCTQCHVKAG
jgi:hypothetical protein